MSEHIAQDQSVVFFKMLDVIKDSKGRKGTAIKLILKTSGNSEFSLVPLFPFFHSPVVVFHLLK